MTPRQAAAALDDLDSIAFGSEILCQQLTQLAVVVDDEHCRFGRAGQRLFNKGRHVFSDVPTRVDAGLFAHWWRRSWSAALLREFGFSSREIPDEPAPVLTDDFGQISWSELSHYMRDILLRDSDQMAMAVSLEVRVPFLDHELVEFVLGLPATEKQQPGITKSLLVDSVRDLIPCEIYSRPKMGFELPMSEWIRGPLHQFTASGLKHLVDHRIFPVVKIDELRRRFSQGKLSWQKLWALVVLGWYLDKENVLNLAQGSSRR